MKKLWFTIGLCSSLSLNAQVTSGLNAYFKFDGNNVNSKGGTAAKIYNCDFVNDRQGNPGSAVYTKGLPNSFVNLGTSSILKPTAGSVSLWVNPEDINNGGSGFDNNPILIAKNNASKSSYFEGYGLYLRRTNKKLLIITTRESNSAERFVYTTDSVGMDKWHHVVFVYNFDSLWFYVNNVLQGRVARGFDQVFATGDSVLMGRVKGGSNERYFNGAIDDVRIYNRKLSAKEVDTLFKLPATLSKREFNEVDGKTMLSFPNPSSGKINLNGNIHIVYYAVFDLSGRLIKSGNETRDIDITGNSGMYQLVCMDSNGYVRTEKILIH